MKNILAILFLIPIICFGQKKLLFDYFEVCKEKDSSFLVGLESITNGVYRRDYDNTVRLIRESPINIDAADFAPLFQVEKYRPSTNCGTDFLYEYSTPEGTGLLISGLVITDIYNTVRFDWKRRTETSIDEFVMDFLRTLYPIIKKTNYKELSVHVTSINKNFIDHYASYMIEGLIFSTKINILKQFVENAIADQDVKDSSAIYLLANESKFYKKVRL